MKLYQLSPDGLACEYDTAKDLVVGALINDGLLKEEDGKDWASEHSFIVRQPSKISKWIARLLGNDAETDRVFLVTLAKGRDN